MCLGHKKCPLLSHQVTCFALLFRLFFLAASNLQRKSNTGLGFLGWLLFCISWLLVVVTFPFSLCVLLKVGIHYPIPGNLKEHRKPISCPTDYLGLPQTLSKLTKTHINSSKFERLAGFVTIKR